MRQKRIVCMAASGVTASYSAPYSRARPIALASFFLDQHGKGQKQPRLELRGPANDGQCVEVAAFQNPGGGVEIDVSHLGHGPGQGSTAGAASIISPTSLRLLGLIPD